jgi:hypothetical protein
MTMTPTIFIHFAPRVGVDQWGDPTGREAAHYGDFLTRVRETNSLIDKLLGVRNP